MVIEKMEEQLQGEREGKGLRKRVKTLATSQRVSIDIDAIP